MNGVIEPFNLTWKSVVAASLTPAEGGGGGGGGGDGEGGPASV